MKMTKRIFGIVLAMLVVLSVAPFGIQSASADAYSIIYSAISGKFPIVTYATPLSGASKVYPYTDSSLKTKYSNYWIDTFSDQIVITSISTNYKAVMVCYPSSSSSTGYRSLWFSVDDIVGMSAINISSYTAVSSCTTFCLSSASGVKSCGSISANDSCIRLGSRSVGGTTYYPTLYPISISTINKISGIKYKIALSKVDAPATAVQPVVPTSQTTVYLQTDSRWKDVPYGYRDAGRNEQAYIGKRAGYSGDPGSGCGLLAITNAVYYLTGKFIDPAALAQLSVNNGYRVNGVGTDWNFPEFAARQYGASCGFKFVKRTASDSELIAHLRSGGVAVAVVPNHLVAMVAYDAGADKVLVLDSAPGYSGRPSTPATWISSSQLKAGCFGTLDYSLLSKK